MPLVIALMLLPNFCTAVLTNKISHLGMINHQG